jgi:hypothetical protein
MSQIDQKTTAHIVNTGFIGCGTAILRKWLPTFQKVVPSLSSCVQGQEELVFRNSCLKPSNLDVTNFCQFDNVIGDVKSVFLSSSLWIRFQEIMSPVRLDRTTSLEGRTCTSRLDWYIGVAVTGLPPIRT